MSEVELFILIFDVDYLGPDPRLTPGKNRPGMSVFCLLIHFYFISPSLRRPTSLFVRWLEVPGSLWRNPSVFGSLMKIKSKIGMEPRSLRDVVHSFDSFQWWSRQKKTATEEQKFKLSLELCRHNGSQLKRHLVNQKSRPKSSIFNLCEERGRRPRPPLKWTFSSWNWGCQRGFSFRFSKLAAAFGSRGPQLAGAAQWSTNQIGTRSDGSNQNLQETSNASTRKKSLFVSSRNTLSVLNWDRNCYDDHLRSSRFTVFLSIYMKRYVHIRTYFIIDVWNNSWLRHMTYV